MTREWVAGDVALVEAGCWANRKVALRLAEGWSHENGTNLDDDGVVSVVRRLVVIDPEDREQAAALYTAYVKASPAADNGYVESMQSALRSLVEPPKPEEPLGIGGVVVDKDGLRWVRVQDQNCAPWMRVNAGFSDMERPYRYYKDITAVRILSPGVTP